MEMLNILHITPHLGAGVGKVLINYLPRAVQHHHKVACLEHANVRAATELSARGIECEDKIYTNLDQLWAMVTISDVVLIHWWNHPLLFDLLVNKDWPPCRIIMWSHVSGLNPAYVYSDKLIDFSDLFVFTTPISYKSNEITNLTAEFKKKLRVVWSTGGVGLAAQVVHKPQDGLVVGYIGTVDYSKLHSGFLSLCSAVQTPNVSYIICGGPKEKELHAEAVKLKIDKKMEFVGWVDDILPYLAQFDVLGYPLSPYHFGTCDQALVESMAAGIPVVVLGNAMERYMVNHGVTGFVAENEQEYVSYLEKLLNDRDLRKSMGARAKENAIKRFSLEKMIGEWDILFIEAMSANKKTRQWKNRAQSLLKPHHVFLESIGHFADVFLKQMASPDDEKLKTNLQAMAQQVPSWQSDTKGTAHHYATYFPEDEVLRTWSYHTRLR